MSKIGLWYCLSVKRQFKRAFFLVLLLLLPVLVFCLSKAQGQEEEGISIALFTEGSQWNDRVVRELLENGHSFDFYLCATEAELLRDVEARRAECGYIFPEDLKERLDQKDYKRSIRAVAAPSTVADKLVEEVVFSGLFSVYGRDLLEDYSREGAPFQGEEAVWEELEPLYDKYLENGSTFSFAYETAGGAAMEVPSVKATFPIRGMVAVFIFIMGLSAGVTACEDGKRGLFSSLSGFQKTGCILACLAGPVSLTCVSGLAALALSGQMGDFAAEAELMFFYGAACTLFAWLAVAVVRQPVALACLIPFFIIGSLALCPVFADLSLFIPEIGVLRRFFLPYYYLAAAGLV